MGLNNQDASNNSGLQLILGLALTLTKQDTPPSNNNVTKPYSSSNHNNYEAEPSLTLGLSTKSYYEEPLDFSTQTNSPHHSVVSSFSSGRVKRERDVSSELEMETTEMERVSSRISDEDEDGATAARKKLRLTKDQSAMLEESFKEHSTLNPVIIIIIIIIISFYSYISYYYFFNIFHIYLSNFCHGFTETEASFSQRVKSNTSSSWGLVPEP